MGQARQPCRQCGGPKPPGGGVAYCSEACRAEGQKKWLANDADYARAACERSRRKAGAKPKPVTISADGQQRRCPACERWLHIRKFTTKTREGYCADCVKIYNHGYHLKSTYGISIDEYGEMLRRQQNGCAICGGRPISRRLAVDHDHKTGQIRGLLCTMCNHKVLGGARESLDVLRAAVAYLESPPAADMEMFVPEKKAAA